MVCYWRAERWNLSRAQPREARGPVDFLGRRGFRDSSSEGHPTLRSAKDGEPKNQTPKPGLPAHERTPLGLRYRDGCKGQFVRERISTLAQFPTIPRVYRKVVIKCAYLIQEIAHTYANKFLSRFLMQARAFPNMALELLEVFHRC